MSQLNRLLQEKSPSPTTLLTGSQKPNHVRSQPSRLDPPNPQISQNSRHQQIRKTLAQNPAPAKENYWNSNSDIDDVASETGGGGGGGGGGGHQHWNHQQQQPHIQGLNQLIDAQNAPNDEVGSGTSNSGSSGEEEDPDENDDQSDNDDADNHQNGIIENEGDDDQTGEDEDPVLEQPRGGGEFAGNVGCKLPKIQKKVHCPNCGHIFLHDPRKELPLSPQQKQQTTRKVVSHAVNHQHQNHQHHLTHVANGANAGFHPAEQQQAQLPSLPPQLSQLPQLPQPPQQPMNIVKLPTYTVFTWKEKSWQMIQNPSLQLSVSTIQRLLADRRDYNIVQRIAKKAILNGMVKNSRIFLVACTSLTQPGSRLYVMSGKMLQDHRVTGEKRRVFLKCVGEHQGAFLPQFLFALDEKGILIPPPPPPPSGPMASSLSTATSLPYQPHQSHQPPSIKPHKPSTKSSTKTPRPSLIKKKSKKFKASKKDKKNPARRK